MLLYKFVLIYASVFLSGGLQFVQLNSGITFCCSWRFLRFDRDWKKIEDFVVSKTVIQVIVSDSLLLVSYFRSYRFLSSQFQCR